MMLNKEKNFVSAVVYVHNAENRIEEFLDVVIKTLESNFEHSEVICVNDCSDDKSAQKIENVSKRAVSASVSIINMSYFHGLEMAMDAGRDLTIGDFVFEFDNTCLDFSPEVIMEIYNKSLTGYDIVSASANKKEKLSSKVFYRVFNRFSELKYNMTTESFRVMSRRVINRISSMNKTIPYRKASYLESGLKTANIKYEVVNSAMKSVDARETRYRASLAVDSLILFTEVGYRFSFFMTFFMMLISLFMVIYTCIVYIIGHPIEGWTTMVLFLSVGFLGVFGIMTIMIKYLQIIVDMVFKRKHYSFESIEKLTTY